MHWKATAARAWPWVFCLYGANLYFPLSGNLNDPVVHPLVPASKDVLWIAFLACIVVRDRAVIRRDLPLALLIAVPAVIFAIASLLHLELSWSYFRTCKNLMLYLGGGLLFLDWLARESLVDQFMISLRWALTTSLAVSILCFYAAPPSIDLRMYGTYGNPTSLGLAGLLTIALIRHWLVYCIAFYCIFFAGSLSIIAACLVFAPLCFALGREWRAKEVFIYYACLLAVFAFIGLLDLQAFGVNRILSWTLDSDSIGVRVQELDYLSMRGILLGTWPESYFRANSTVVAFLFNFGVVPTMILLAPLIVALYYVERYPIEIAVLLMVSALLNIPVQHQYEIYPTAFFFAFMIAFGRSAMYEHRSAAGQDSGKFPTKGAAGTPNAAPSACEDTNTRKFKLVSVSSRSSCRSAK